MNDRAALGRCLLGAVLACAACGDPEYAVVVRFDPEALGADVARIEVALVPDCDAQAAGEPAAAPIHSVAFRRGEPASPLGAVDAGRYGLYARGLSEACVAVASGCTPVTLEDAGDETLVVTVQRIAGPGCPLGSTCGAGECIGADAGAPADGGVGCADVVMVGGGVGTSCAVTTVGTLYCWGAGQYGELGDGSTPMTRPTPMRAGDGATWTAVDVGGEHACGMKTDGSLWCWGRNHHGQLGVGDDTARAVPTRVGTGTSWIEVHTGGDHTCALDDAGDLWCWGQNHVGQLGIGDSSDRNVPQRIAGHTWVDFDTGFNHTCGVTAGGELQCWGGNTLGELGTGSTTDANAPVSAGTDTDWAVVGAGDRMTCAIKTDRTLWCWGSNDEGQLADGTYDGSVDVPHPDPAQVGDGTDWEHVAAGDNNVCGLRLGGALWCWGDNDNGESGIGSGDSRVTTPTRVGALDGWSGIEGGEDFACAILGGELYCWGSAADLGLGEPADRNVPGIVCLPL